MKDNAHEIGTIVMHVKPITPMLLDRREIPPEDTESYTYQLKYDGHRCLLFYDQEKGVRLFTKNFNECTDQYIEFKELRFPGVKSLVLDGEMIVLVDQRPCFESVIKRLKTRSLLKVKHLSESLPAHLVAFDLLVVNEREVMNQPLEQRQRLLNEYVSLCPILSIAQNFNDGQDLFEATKKLGLEGIVCKRKSSRYTPGRSTDWIKIKNYLYGTASIVAIRKGKFGWLLRKNGRSVGMLQITPSRQVIKSIFARLPQIKIGEDNTFIYVKPILCKLKFQCYTKKGYLRSASFVSFEKNNDLVKEINII